MNNLIRAELFRLKKRGYISKLILVMLSCIPLSFMGDDYRFNRLAASQSMLFCVIISTMIIVLPIADGYGKRTALYEVMDGRPAMQIIAGKYIVYLPFLLIFYYLPMSAILLINEGGRETVVFLLLELLILVRFVTVGISSVLILKSGEAAAIPAALVLPMSIPIVFHEVLADASGRLPKIFDFFMPVQIMSVGKGVTPELAAEIIIYSVIVIAISTILAYMSLTKKWRINSRLF